MAEEKPSQTPETSEPRELFSASNTPASVTQTAILVLEDNPIQKFAGCISFDYYNITFKCQVTRAHLGKFLDFLLNAKWKGEWGSIDVEEILKVEKTEPLVRTNFSEET